jgi:hypothetical protein
MTDNEPTTAVVVVLGLAPRDFPALRRAVERHLYAR